MDLASQHATAMADVVTHTTGTTGMQHRDAALQRWTHGGCCDAAPSAIDVATQRAAAHGGSCAAAPATTGASTRHATAMAEAAKQRAATTAETAMQRGDATMQLQRRPWRKLRRGDDGVEAAMQHTAKTAKAAMQRRRYDAAPAALQWSHDGASMQPLPTGRPPPPLWWCCLPLCYLTNEKGKETGGRYASWRR